MGTIGRLLGFLSLRKGSPIRVARRNASFWIRKQLSRRNSRASKAVLIGITGSSAKSSTTMLTAHILAGHDEVYLQVQRNSIHTLIDTLRRVPKSTRYVVVEAGVAAKGQMKPMAETLQPSIAVVTMVGVEHYSSFRNREAVAEEKGWLVELVRPGGFALLNADDDLVMAMASRTRERVVTYGRSAAADYRVVTATAAFPDPLQVTIAWKGGTVSLRTTFAGEHFWLSTVAAFATAVELGVPVETIVSRMADYEGIQTRCQPYPTPGGPTFLVDSVKAPWGTLDLAWKMMADARAPHKRIVLGQISDYAGASRPKYAKAYQAARAVSDQVMFVGENAHRSRASEDDIRDGRFVAFANAEQVSRHVKATARPDEVILLKGSANLHLERVALAWTHDVRCWETACGRQGSCFSCGLYEFPFAEHPAIRDRMRRQRFWDKVRFWRKPTQPE